MIEQITKEDVINLVMEIMDWKLSRAISWYKTENRWFKGNSPKELVQRGNGQDIVDFLELRRQELSD